MADRLEGRRLVATRKVSDYLMNLDHPQGGSKARFFQRFGFDPASPAPLVEALLDHPERNEIVSESDNAFGAKRIVECHLQTPDGRDPCIRTVWLREDGDDVYRLVTAIPLTPRQP